MKPRDKTYNFKLYEEDLANKQLIQKIRNTISTLPVAYFSFVIIDLFKVNSKSGIQFFQTTRHREFKETNYYTFEIRVDSESNGKQHWILYRKILQRQNRNEKIFLSEMESEIEAELTDYYEELEKMQFVKNSKSTPISNYELLQIKKLYRKIAMMIHPDLHPELFDKFEIAELWNKAKNAYIANNYEELKETEFLIVQAIKKYSHTEEIFEIKNIDEKIEKLRKEIEKIISSDPYQYKFLLENADLIEEEINSIKNETEQYRQYIDELNEIFSNFTITEILN